jgi:hypothetical protein
MGKHYVPQRYLRGFQDKTRPGFIWMYDKQLGTRKLLPISKVAQEPDFYSPDVEEALNEHVEKPANAVIDKLRAGGSLTDQDRAILAYYVDTMVRRVPVTRQKSYGALPQVLKDTIREVKDFIEAQGREGRLKPETVAKRLAEADAYEKKFQNQPPSEVVKIVETPWPTQQPLAIIFSMEWRFLTTNGPTFFVTSDNPAYFFEAFGLGTKNSELAFPITSELLLHCSWQKMRVPIRLAEQDLVKELNRRNASGASRFIFYHEDRDWLLSAGQHTVAQLSRINWQD